MLGEWPLVVRESNGFNDLMQSWSNKLDPVDLGWQCQMCFTYAPLIVGSYQWQFGHCQMCLEEPIWVDYRTKWDWYNESDKKIKCDVIKCLIMTNKFVTTIKNFFDGKFKLVWKRQISVETNFNGIYVSNDKRLQVEFLGIKFSVTLRGKNHLG